LPEGQEAKRGTKGSVSRLGGNRKEEGIEKTRSHVSKTIGKKAGALR